MELHICSNLWDFTFHFAAAAGPSSTGGYSEDQGGEGVISRLGVI